MNVLASECNSRCESGWTLYLEHSFVSPYPSHEFADTGGAFTGENRAKDWDEEEDLSMVSDASSGPPLVQEDEKNGNGNNGCLYHVPTDATLPKKIGRRKKIKEGRHPRAQELPNSFLDDTASSPIFNFSTSNFSLNNDQAPMQNILDFSQGHSATQFEASSAFQGHFGFFQSSPAGNQLQQNQLS